MALIGGGSIQLRPGQTLAFKPSQGLTAIGATAKMLTKQAPPPRYTPPRIPVGTRPPQRPGPDPYAALSQQQLDSRATDLANADLLPQQQAIQRQQQIADEEAKGQESQITGFSDAAASYLSGIPDQVGAGYQAAAGTVGALGAGVGGQVGADLAAKQAADQAFADSQGQSGGSTVSAPDLGSTISYLGGAVPAAGLAQQGAAEQALAANAVQIPLDAGKEQLDARMAQARTDNDQYAQQLISLAATFPGLKAQALQQLNQYEIDKANYREQVTQNKVTNKRNAAGDAEQKRVDNANIAHTNRSDALATRAEIAQEKLAGIKSQQDTSALAYKWASLTFKSKQEADKARAQGKIIDVQASKLMGHVIYKDGSEDPSIKVKQTVANSPRLKAQYNRDKTVGKARVAGFNYAVKLRGKVTSTDKNVLAAARATGKPVGQYVADPQAAARGFTYPPAYPGAPPTTNKLGLAAYSGGGASNYADAQQKVWAEIDGDGLMARYGYSRERVLAIINDVLKRAGWHK